MILSGLPRVRALCVAWLVAFVAWIVLWPCALLPVLAIEEGPRVLVEFPASYAEVLFSPSLWLDRVEGALWLWLFGSAAVLSAAQVLFVAPLVGPVALGAEPRPMRVSSLAAIALALAIVLMVGLALFHAALLLVPEERRDDFASSNGVLIANAIFLAWLVGSIPASIALWRVGSSPNPSAILRMARLLLAGTALNLVLSLPVYLIARRKTGCFCTLPTFFSLVGGLASLVFLAGPFAVLFLTRDFRRRWVRERCEACGYMRARGASRCSECGTAFGDAEQSAARGSSHPTADIS